MLEALTGKGSVAELARKHRVKDSMIYNWRTAVLERLRHVLKVQTPNAECEERIC